MSNNIYFFEFIFSLIASLMLTPRMGKLAIRLGVVDRPAHRKIHANNVPYFGGAAIFAALILAAAWGGVVGLYSSWLEPLMVFKGGIILFCSLGVMSVGLLDDAKQFSPVKKFLGQIFFASLFVFLGFRLEVLGIPGLLDFNLPTLLTIPLTIFWILAMINAVNMVDGSDGLAGAVTASGMVILAAAALILDDSLVALLALAALGAILGFLVFNWKPARIYLGDAGSNGLGMFLAGSLIALGQERPVFFAGGLHAPVENPFPYHFLVLTLMIFYPVLEITLSVVRRTFHGQPVYRADRGHIHHRLMKKSFSAPQIALVGAFLMFLPGIAALSIIRHSYGQAAWLLALTGLVLGISLTLLNFFDFLRPKVLEYTRPHYQIADHFINMQRLKMSLATTREELLALVGQTCQEFGVKRCHLMLTPDEKGKGGLDYYHRWDENQPSEYLDFLLTSDKPDSTKFYDKYKLPDGKGGAQWTFDPNDRLDLDVEYSVLMSEFMRSVLEAAVRLGKNEATLEFLEKVPHILRSVSTHGHNLRKRQQMKQIVRGAH